MREGASIRRDWLVGRMKIFISNVSALQLPLASSDPQRRIFGSRSSYPLVPTRAVPPKKTAPDVKLIRSIGFPDGVLTDRLHVNVADASSRGSWDGLVYHVWNGPNHGSYLRVDDTYCVQTPEACFAQMALELKLPHLVELGMLLCGTYVPEEFPNVPHSDLKPLTNVKKLARYIARLEGQKGLRNARMALPYILEGSASPMESKLAVAFALSTRHGGFGMPPVLNVEIKLSDQARGRGWWQTRKPDLIWPNDHVSLDYDSREWHDMQARADEDERRRNELAAMGLRGIVARPADLRDAVTFEALAGQVAAAMGKKLQSKTRELPSKRFSLYQDLFGNSQWDPLARA